MSDSVMPRWERRFRAPTLSMPDWPTRAPDRIGYEGTESGIWQVHVWQRGTGLRRKVTDHPVGVVTASFDVDGDAHPLLAGRDRRRIRPVVRAAVRGWRRAPLPRGRAAGWNEGFARAPGVVAASVSDRDGFAIYISLAGGEAKELYRSTEFVAVGGDGGYNRGGLSADGALLCLSHSEHGDLMHPALRVVDPRTGGVIAEQLDEGKSLTSAAWSPVGGRPAARRDPRARRRGGPRDLGAGERRVARSRDRARGTRAGARLVARRVGAAPAPRARGPAPPVPVRPRRRRAHVDRAPRGPDQRRPRPARRPGVAAPRIGHDRPEDPRRHGRGGADRRGRARARGSPVRLLALRERARAVRARLLRHARGRGPLAVPDAPARRPHVAR